MPQFLREVGGRAAHRRMRRALAAARSRSRSSPAAAAPRRTCSRSSARAPTATPTSRCSSPTTAPSPATARKHELPGDLLLEARELTRDLSEQAELNLALPPGPNSVLSYKVRMEAGTIAFADTSRPLPRSFTELTVFTKRRQSKQRLR